jgi:uncharacterized repeat protein (TIGR01451 family)
MGYVYVLLRAVDKPLVPDLVTANRARWNPLRIWCDAPDVMTLGRYLTYIVTVNNFGSAKVSFVSVSDLVPNGLIDVSVVASQGSCIGPRNYKIEPLGSFPPEQSFSGSNDEMHRITCHLGDLKGGATATLNITAEPSVSGLLSNFATVTGQENGRDFYKSSFSHELTFVQALDVDGKRLAVYKGETKAKSELNPQVNKIQSHSFK